MDLISLSVRRPVFTTVLAAMITIFGLVSLSRLGIREYPAMDPPAISVSTTYTGASADVVETQVSQPLEQAINAVAGIESIRSISREGGSLINAEFSLDTNLDTAASDIRDQIGRAIRDLPADVDPPVLNKANADSSPILSVVVRSDSRSQLELSAIAENLRERLQTVPGVASVDQAAAKRYAMRLWMDADLLSAHGLTPLDVRSALLRENVELASGRIEGENVDLLIRTVSRLETPEEFESLVLKREGDRAVRFRDVGYAELGAENERSALKVGNEPVAGLYFRAQPGANQIEISDEIRRRLAQVRRELPGDVRAEIAYDNTDYVRKSLAEVVETIGIAFLLVVLVVFLFLREWRSTIIPVLAIPVSVVGAFIILDASGFSINTLTLLGIVLAIGLVVDDAIVVLENIFRKIEAGRPAAEAAIEGTREIFFAVIATTVVLIVVFLPLLFLGGLSGRLFREFGVTISGAVVVSSLVALTLTPMLCSKLLRPHREGSTSWFYRRTEPIFDWLEHAYSNALRGTLTHRWFAPVCLAGAVVASWQVLVTLPRELTPLEDRGRLWIRATAPEGVGFDYMQSFMDQLTGVVDARTPESHVMMTQVPGSGGGFGAVGSVNSGFIRVILNDASARDATQQDIARRLQQAVRHLNGARVNIQQESSVGRRRSTGAAVQFVVQAPSLVDLASVLPAFLQEVQQDPVFSFVESDLQFNKPELRVSIDRRKTESLGVSAADVARTMQASFSGQRFDHFILEGRQYPVIGQVTRNFRSSPDDLGKIGVRTPTGEIVPLDNLVVVAEGSSPPELYRYNRYVAAIVSGTLAPGRSMGEGIGVLRDIAKKTLDGRFSTELTGSARDFEESSSSLGWVFGLAIVLIYLVLAAQFESYLDPVVIMATVPLALAGALLALWYFGQSMNIFSQIGIIMLVGLVTKNGILIVEFAKQRRILEGLDPGAAVHQGAVARLRPILMTSLATILGILPVALALGAGSEGRMSLGIAVVGGLVFGGFLTLFVVPSVYALVYRTGSGVHSVPIQGNRPAVPIQGPMRGN